ncbi:hypothetical protein GALMADRAFT_147565 [Galerina marginata CBS 339.88]|uniref:Uncharacterized protein n=1 Tax=Galerina marginata (strain CBS 339.88) TaxID=685588 RepID=A0A067S7V9_GALM3|nr:hypothetical protein GALMADRAFT_147565 [Galerina marginata CBS 339.88]
MPSQVTRIFSTVTLSTRVFARSPSDRRRRITSLDFQEIGRVIARSPSVAGYIRTLNCQLHPSDFENGDVSDILRKFNDLQSLTIKAHKHLREPSAVTGDEDQVKLMDYGLEQCTRSLHDALTRLVHLPTLMSLKLGHLLNLPIEVLAKAIGLHTLNIHRCQFTGAPPFHSSSNIAPSSFQLRTLKLYPDSSLNVDTLKNWSPQVMDSSKIQQVAFKFRAQDDRQQLEDLLNGMFSLETLTLEYTHWPPFNEPIMRAPDFRTLDNLHHLVIRCELLDGLKLQSEICSIVHIS